MKKMTLVSAAALACIATTAMAQDSATSVTLYGIADAGINHVTGLKQGSVTHLASGIMEGSRWGLKGNEELGGGYKAIFTLESRVELDTGATYNTTASGSQLPDRVSSPAALGIPTNAQNITLMTGLVNGAAAGIGAKLGVNHEDKNLFDRQAYVGLITPVGAITAGRQYTPGYLAVAAFDSMHTESSLAVGQLVAVPVSFNIRVSNSLQYGIKTGGLTATAMYAAAEGSTKTGRLAGVMAMYKGDGYGFGAGYNTQKNELGKKSLTNVILGATADIGPGILSMVAANIKDDNPSGLSGIAAQLTPGAVALLTSNNVPNANLVGAAAAAAVQNAFINGFKQNSNVFHIGYRMTMGPNTVTVAYNTMNDKTAANADRASYGVAYTYALSKRTDLNAVLTHFNNKNTSQLAPGGNGFLGGVTRAAGVDSNNVAFGIRHRF